MKSNNPMTKQDKLTPITKKKRENTVINII